MSSAPGFDHAAVLVRPAATIMLLEDRPDLQVLLPGDADYDTGRDLGMRAWIRLWPEGG